MGGREPSFALQPKNSISKSEGLGKDLSLLAICLYTMFTYDDEVPRKMSESDLSVIINV